MLRGTSAEQKCSGFSLYSFAEGGLRLATYRVSIDVFRAALLSIVLTLAVGQNASLLCAVWCHPLAGLTGACEHQEPSTSPSVADKDDCPEVSAPATSFVREDVRREGSAPDTLYAVVVPPFRFSPPSQSVFGSKPGHRPPVDALPLVLPLRI